jgi:hypothetical protein
MSDCLLQMRQEVQWNVLARELSERERCPSALPVVESYRISRALTLLRALFGLIAVVRPTRGGPLLKCALWGI